MNRISGLYAVTPAGVDDDWLDAKLRQVLKGGASAVQFRGKDVPYERALRQAALVVQRCREHGACSLINDDVGLAACVAADGVHLGRYDESIAAARARLGPSAVIGASCYDDLRRAEDAVRCGADYVAFGSFFPSRVKPQAVRASPDLLSEARRLHVPIVAIGGIDATNARQLIARGADAVAVLSALFDAQDSEAAARAFVRLFDHQSAIETP